MVTMKTSLFVTCFALLDLRHFLPSGVIHLTSENMLVIIKDTRMTCEMFSKLSKAAALMTFIQMFFSLTSRVLCFKIYSIVLI